jgi:S-adenosylmethionine hydrolase
MGIVITLLTDFGTVDGYVGAMKGVLLTRAPDAQVVDLTHEISPQDVITGAWALKEAAPWFPPGTIHLSVVDPGVGTTRRALLLKSEGHLFVGPDNGLLSLAAGGAVEGWLLDRPQWFCQPVSNTFHGRDIFASVAGHLAAGVAPELLGSPVQSWAQLDLPAPRRDQSQVIGQIARVDRFGNLITNVDQPMIGDLTAWEVSIGGITVGPIQRTFGDVRPGQWVAYLGSGGMLEIAVREGRAVDLLRPLGGTKVKVILCER